MPELADGEMIARYVEREGAEYVVGIPGRGSVNVLDGSWTRTSR